MNRIKRMALFIAVTVAMTAFQMPVMADEVSKELETVSADDSGDVIIATNSVKDVPEILGGAGDTGTDGNFRYRVSDDGITATITGYQSRTSSGSLNIPSTVDGYTVTSIGTYAFKGCNGFTGSLTIPNSVTSIGYGAFYDCSGLTGSLTIPDSVTSMGDMAFYDCSGFTGSLTIPDSVTSIGNYAFDGCSGFTGSLTIPDSVTSMGDLAFYDCSGFTGSLTIPDSVTSIGDLAFYDCSGFTGSLTIPDSVTSIGNDAFMGCNGFTKVVNKSKENIFLHNLIYTKWFNEATEEEITEIANGVAIREDYEEFEYIDADGDGLWDYWEKHGADVDGDGVVDVQLDKMGADPKKPDIFVEVDWMIKPEEKYQLFGTIRIKPACSLAPTQESLRLVHEAFAKHGINLHIDAGENSIMNYDTGETWRELSEGTPVDYVEVLDKSNKENDQWKEYKDKYFDKNRHQIFRHCIFINQFNDFDRDTGTWIPTSMSGIAGYNGDNPGDDQHFLVANQDWVRKTGNIGVGGTFMHELGHTLGLYHGGFEGFEFTDLGAEESGEKPVSGNNDCFKPNYLSIMNYSFQVNGLTGTNELNYSEYDLPDIDEKAIDLERGFDPYGLTLGTGLGTVIVQGVRNHRLISKAPIIPIAEEPISLDFFHDFFGEYSTISYDLNNDGYNLKLTSSKDWPYIKYKVGEIGVSENTVKLENIDILHSSPEEEEQSYSVNNGVSKELALEEALEKGVYGNVGDGAIEPIGPYTLMTGQEGQRVYIRVENHADEGVTLHLDVAASEISDEYSSDVEIEASVSEVSYRNIPIDVKKVERAGEYEINAVLTYNGKEKYKTTIPVEYSDITPEILNRMIENSPDSFPSDILEEYRRVINKINSDKKDGESKSVLAQTLEKTSSESFTAGSDTYTVSWNSFVQFDGRKHNGIGTDASGNPASSKESATKVSDLRVTITKNGELVDPSKYTVKTKNNKNASVSIDGITAIQTNSKKLPSFTIKFKGKEYKAANKAAKNETFEFGIIPTELKQELVTFDKVKIGKDGSVQIKQVTFKPEAGASGGPAPKPVKLKYKKQESKTDYVTSVNPDGSVMLIGKNNFFGSVVYKK